MTLQDKVDHLPFEPGVYQFKDKNDTIIYVGKAKKLRNRVRSYFQDSRNHDGRIKVMVSKIKDVEVIVTDSEGEALILENNLIKKYNPRYNIMYRDDKSYPYICVTNDERPRVFPTRTVIKDGSQYFGPYDSVVKMKRMLEITRKTFGLCTCAVSPKLVDRTRGMRKWHSCFNEYIDECSGDWDHEEYQETMKKVLRLLHGKPDQLIKDLREEMELASQALNFEYAAKIRDGIEALRKYSEKMKIVTAERNDRDVFGIYCNWEEDVACGVLFKIREGKMMGTFNKFIKGIEEIPEDKLLQSFVEDYYTSAIANVIPDEVYFSHEWEDTEPLEVYLWEARGKKVVLHQPKIGEKAQMVKMAIANARLRLSEYILNLEKSKHERIPHSIKALQRDIGLQRLPRRIECFDNSNIQGSDPVASMVCVVDGRPRKSEYKRFNIKTVTGPDDFASMREVVSRRYSRVMKDKLQIPDLIIVDGGKGQLSSAVQVLKEIGFYGQCEIVGLAKRLEEVFVPGRAEPIMIPKTSSGLKLIQRLRDEAHRFAITFHREKRRKRTIQSELEQIPGIGPATREKLIKELGSAKRVREASVDELASVVGPKTAQSIREFYDTPAVE
jgi:excinuclease ABC subunit C